MRQTFNVLIIFLIFCSSSIAQNFTEYYFKFDIKDKTELESLTRIISIDNVINNTVYAYSTDKNFKNFKSLNYKYTLLLNPSKSAKVDMATTVAEMADWDKYPTHEVYTEMMCQFGTNYPDICKIDTVGFSEDGREVLVAKISDNVNTQEDEPEVLYTGQMHGDEIVCYILFLRMIDHLLENYSSDTQAQNIINNIELWINPLSNPDGTYAGGNNTVNSATRSNSNGVDLNRNYPDPDNGAHPDGESYQAETQMMMDFADAHNFNLSINSHSGAEVMNYPWDTWSRRHVDDGWYQYASLIYADLAIANSPSGYFTGISSSGITNGYDWYSIAGGRQDYMNYYKNCREITLELSNDKMLSASQLPNHWNYNKDAMLAFIEESLNGVRGIVKDSDGNPLSAMITIENHDSNEDSSMVFTDPDVGDYHRMLDTATYNIIASAYGYFNDTAKNIVVSLENIVIVNFELIFKDDSILLKTDPAYINDTLFYDQIVNHNILISNDSSAVTTTYNIEIENPTENSWLEINKNSGILSGTENDTVIATINSDLLSAGYYSTNIFLTSADYKIDTIPVNIVVKDTLTTIIKPEITDFKLYPNPFSDQINIEFYVYSSDYVKISMFNICGNVIFEKDINSLNNNKNNIVLNDLFNIQNIPKGIYFMQISTSNYQVTKRIIKN